MAVCGDSILGNYVIRRKTLKKIKEEADKFEKEKAQFENIIEKAESNYQAQLLHIQNIYKTIQDLQNKIATLQESPEIESCRGDLQALLNKHLMTEDNWKNFRDTFSKEYPVFFNTLISEFPELTESNLRVIVLQKLGFTNNEIGGLLGITPDAVKKSKQRLRIKLADRYEHFTDIIIAKNAN